MRREREKRSIMNSNEKCVTALQALWNVTYAHVRRGFALTLEEEDDGLLSWDTTPLFCYNNREWPRPQGISCAVFLLKLQVKSPPNFFLLQGWLVN